MAGDDKKLVVNGTTSGYNPTTQDNITMALLQNGGVKRIQETLQQRLDEAGWTQSLREYATRLLRSGEATTFDDVMKIVTRQISLQQEREEGNKGAANGNANGSGVPDLMIPRAAAEDAAMAVKKELREVVKME